MVVFGLLIAVEMYPRFFVLSRLGPNRRLGGHKDKEEKMQKLFAVTAVLALLCLGSLAQANITIDTVPVGDVGNAADTRYATPGYGSVGYAYNIGKYEVTAGQYTDFLNAVAATDTYELYNNWEMSRTDGYGCGITRGGVSGSYTYSVATDFINRPVTAVSWGDCARFANWLHNGQPTGAQGLATMEDGAYYVNGATTDAALNAVTHKADWTWAITSEDEWYKAAYYKGGSTSAGYWLYPTQSDSITTGKANYNSVGRTTGIGSYAYPSPYGTFDQGGNVYEWNEALLYGAFRGVRGGSFDYGYVDLQASYRTESDPTYEVGMVGFRVSAVPEPSSLLVLGSGILALAGLIRRRR